MSGYYIQTLSSIRENARMERAQISDRKLREGLIWLYGDAYDWNSMDTITLEINGEIREVPPVATIRDLLQFLGIAETRVALELNSRIIRRGEWDSTPIADRDHVEIVQFVGGG